MSVRKRVLGFLIALGIVCLVFVAVDFLILWVSERAIQDGVTPLQAFLPRPSQVIITLVQNFAMITNELAYTLARSIVGLALGVLVALLFGFLSFWNRSFKLFIEPLTYAVNAFPVVGLAPLLILVFGQGSDLGIVFLAMLIAYFPVFISVRHAIDNVPRGIQDIGEIWEVSKIKSFRYIYLPETTGALIGSLRLAFPASVIGATIGEWLGTRHGIGQLVATALYQFDAAMLYAGLTALLVVCMIALGIIVLATKIFVPATGGYHE